MQKMYRLCVLCLVMLCCGQVSSSETRSFASCPLLWKAAYELTDKDRVILDILQQDNVKSKGDFHWLTEVDGKFPDPFEKAYQCYLSDLTDFRPTRERYLESIKKASEFLLTILYPGSVKPPEVHNVVVEQVPYQQPVASGECAALLIGINYTGQKCNLNSCISDVENILNKMLVPHLGVKSDNLIYMTDYTGRNFCLPRKDNILRQIKNFVEKVNQTKIGYFHYSGHGTTVSDCNFDEADGFDEAMVPIDAERSGVITDDELYQALVKGLGSDTRLLITMDCCHSATILDLPYKWRLDGSYTVEHHLTKKELDSLPRVVMLSGCQDKQTSADGNLLTVDGKSSGALTAAFLKVLESHDYHITYRQLLKEVEDLVRISGYSQIPELTSSYFLNLDDYYLQHRPSIKL